MAKEQIKNPTAEEIGDSPLFAKNLQALIDEYEKGRLINPGEGRRFKRTPYDSLKDKGLFTPEGLSAEFRKIANRESKLSHAEREAVAAAVLTAADRTGAQIKAKREKEAAKKQATAEKAPKKAGVAPEKKSGTDPRPARKRSTSAKSAENKPEE